jgi:hypothetical protein
MAGAGDRVRRRRVFYIPGYDPFHPRRYRELYRKEGAEQARISGYSLRLSPGQRGERYGWHVAFAGDGGATEAEVEVLVWSDIVAASMGQSIAATYWQLLKTVRVYVGSGAIFRLLRLRKGPAIAALYPIGVLIGQAGLAIAAGLAALALVRRAAVALWPLAPAAAPAALGLGLGAGAGTALLRWFRRHDNRIFAWYLMHDFAFTASAGGAVPDPLRPRLRAFADRVAEALGEDWDEVLVVGHSSGAHLAVTVLADLIRRGRVPEGGAALGFLSLGQVVPMVSFLPGGEDLRRDLAFLSQRGELTWVDVTAPGDGCAYALCDPVAVSGVATAAKRWPLVVSAAFTQTLSPERRQALRWRFFRLHFQYLCAFDRPGDYDYFRITAGPMTLAARYRGRAPSQSRIERAVARFGRAG